MRTRRGYRLCIAKKTYVLDTSVLLSDPTALHAFEDNEVVLPIIVLTELESKRIHPELGWAARTALRTLEALREEHGLLTEALPIGDEGGTVRVEINHKDDGLIPEPLREANSNDHRILTVAANLRADGAEVVLVTQDLPLRLRAGVIGMTAVEFRHTDDDADWRGVVELDVKGSEIDKLYSDRSVRIDALDALAYPVHTGVVLTAPGQSVLGRLEADGNVRLVNQNLELFGARGRNPEQRIALDLLEDESIGIVSLGGPAGTGKSVLALAAGLDAVMEKRTHRRILIFRPLYAVGGQEIGFLPGTEEEKMRPWTDAVHDALDSIASPEAIDEIIRQELVEVLPLTYIRGRTLSDTFVIIDEAQNLERSVLLTALSRLGEGSRVVLTHDVAQRDNLRVGRYDGIGSVISSLRGNPLFAHISLTTSERSEIAALVSTALDY